MTAEMVVAAKTRADLIEPYARAVLRQCFQQPAEASDWPSINGAILARWSPSGLVWIKQQAWKRAELYARAEANQ